MRVDALTLAQNVETRERQGEQRRIWWLWEKASPVEIYRGEVLDHVQAFLFGRDPAACRYLAETTDFWFKFKPGGLFARETDLGREGDRPATEVPRRFEVRLGPPGIELFLSPHGVGVLSIAFEATGSADEWYVRELDYRLCQIRPFTAYPFRLPYAEAIQTPPPSDAPLEQRLGAPGGIWTLAELSDRLIAPLQALDHRWVQGQCSVYSVTRFGSDVHFTGRDIKGLRAFLYASAHIEEYHHVGSLKITEALLNPRHWAAVGSLGVAHLVADQDPPHPFDAQRVPVVLFTSFVPYLLSLLQRLTLQRLLDEARRQVVAGTAESGGDTQGPRGLQALRGLHWQMPALNVNGYFTEISSRERSPRGAEIPPPARISGRRERRDQPRTGDHLAPAVRGQDRGLEPHLYPLCGCAGLPLGQLHPDPDGRTAQGPSEARLEGALREPPLRPGS